MKIGAYFKKIRLAKDWPQGKVAKRAFIDQPYLSILEKFSRMPNFDVACRICEALNITPTELWKNIRDEYIKERIDEEKRDLDYRI